MEKFRLKILTPEGTVMDKDVAGLYLRGAEGDLAVFAGHIPFVTPVNPENALLFHRTITVLTDLTMLKA